MSCRRKVLGVCVDFVDDALNTVTNNLNTAVNGSGNNLGQFLGISPTKILDPVGAFGGKNALGGTGLRDQTVATGKDQTILDPAGFFSPTGKNIFGGQGVGNWLGTTNNDVQKFLDPLSIHGNKNGGPTNFGTQGIRWDSYGNDITNFLGFTKYAVAAASLYAGGSALASGGGEAAAGEAAADGGGDAVDETVNVTDVPVDAGGSDYSTTGTQLDGDTVPTLSDTVGPTSDTVVPTDAISQNVAGAAGQESLWTSLGHNIATGIGAGIPGALANLLRPAGSSPVPTLQGSRPAQGGAAGNVYLGSQGSSPLGISPGPNQGLFGNSSATVPLVMAAGLILVMIMNRKQAA